MDGTGQIAGASGHQPASAIIERLDAIGRLLAHGIPPTAAATLNAREVEAHLVTRIDMLGRIVEQLLADREEEDLRLAALTHRLVDLEGRLVPALEACADHLSEAVPLLAEASIDRLPGGGTGLRLALCDLRDVIAALDRRIGMPGSSAPGLPSSAPSGPKPAGAAPGSGPAPPRSLATRLPGPSGPPGTADPAILPSTLASADTPQDGSLAPLLLMEAIDVASSPPTHDAPHDRREADSGSDSRPGHDGGTGPDSSDPLGGALGNAFEGEAIFQRLLAPLMAEAASGAADPPAAPRPGPAPGAA